MANAYYELIINGRKTYTQVGTKYKSEVKVLLEQAVLDDVITDEELERYLSGEKFKCASLTK